MEKKNVNSQCGCIASDCTESLFIMPYDVIVDIECFAKICPKFQMPLCCQKKEKKRIKIKNMQRNVLMVCTLWGVPRIVCYEMNTLKLKLRLCNMHREQYAPYHILKHHADLSIFNGNNNVIKYE